MKYDLTLGGVLTYWDISQFSAKKQLTNGLQAMGLERFTPKDSTREANLRYSLEEVFNSRSHLIRPTKQKGTFAVVVEQKGDQAVNNHYRQEHTVTIDENYNVTIEPFNRDLGTKIADVYDVYHGRFTRDSVAAALIGLVTASDPPGMQGLTMRERGGLYWLHETHLDLWHQVADLCERSSIKGSTRIYTVSHKMDEQAVRAIRDALINDVKKECHQITDDVENGELGARALTARQEQAQSLKAKVELYESMLGETLDFLRQHAQASEEMAAAAALLASGARSGGQQ